MRANPVPSASYQLESLSLFCAAQGCERFAFLAMLPLFVSYAHEQRAMSAPRALMILAILQALSYLGGLPGGWLADHKLGVHRTTMLGTLLLTLAYGLLALDRASLFWPAFALMVVGQSLFRPGLHVLIARATDADGRARERGFLWHYLSANIGYAAGALFGDWAHAARGWSALFSGAALASLLGVGSLWIGLSRLQRERFASDVPRQNRTTTSQTGSMVAVWLLCSVAIVFWLTAQQAGSSLAVFAALNTEQQVTLFSHSLRIGPGLFAALHGVMVIALLPVFLHLHSRQESTAGSTARRLIWGYVATASAFAVMAAASLRGGDSGRVGSTWLLACYGLLSLAEILLAPLGVSLISRLAPQHKAAQAVGLWFGGSAVGNGLAAGFAFMWGSLAASSILRGVGAVVAGCCDSAPTAPTESGFALRDGCVTANRGYRATENASDIDPGSRSRHSDARSRRLRRARKLAPHAAGCLADCTIRICDGERGSAASRAWSQRDRLRPFGAALRTVLDGSRAYVVGWTGHRSRAIGCRHDVAIRS